jgi:hypothetical protein
MSGRRVSFFEIEMDEEFIYSFTRGSLAFFVLSYASNVSVSIYKATNCSRELDGKWSTQSRHHGFAGKSPGINSLISNPGWACSQ